MGSLEDAAMAALADKQREDREHHARLEEFRREDDERDALISEFLQLMQAKGIAPDITYRETVRHPPRYSGRSDMYANYEPSGVRGWVVTSETPGESQTCDRRGLLLTASGDIWKYEATRPHPAYTGPALVRSAYYQQYRYTGHNFILLFTNERVERTWIEPKDLTESAALYLASLGT